MTSFSPNLEQALNFFFEMGQALSFFLLTAVSSFLSPQIVQLDSAAPVRQTGLESSFGLSGLEVISSRTTPLTTCSD